MTAPVASSPLPPGAVDTHIHILRPDRHPYPVHAADPPPVRTVEDYRLLQRHLGLERVVVVTPSNYGTDNRCTLEAIAEFGQQCARGIAVVDDTVTDADLNGLHAGGIRGIRFNATRPGGSGLELIRPMAERIAPLGWHIQLHCSPETLAVQSKLILALPVPVVLDHLARIPANQATAHAGFATVCRLADAGHTWIKIGGLYHVSAGGPPDYEDAQALAQELAERYPERVLWDTDWPHTPSLRGHLPMPDDLADLSRLRSWAAPEALQRILVTNPTILYDFAERSGVS